MISQRRIEEATSLHREGRLEEAAQKYEALLAIEPGDPTLLNLAGILAGQRGDYTRALMLLQRAVAANPKAPHYRNSLAVTLERVGNFAGAAAEFNEEGNLLLPLYHYPEALTAFGHALRLAPESPQFKCNYAVALIKLGRPQEAADLLAATPDENHLAYIPLNLGNALAGLPKPIEAIAAYDRALTMQPDMVEGHWARGQMLLLTGDYTRGLPEYEWRKKWQHFENPFLALPEWGGQALAKKLLVVTEQGYGDAIQFARYVKMLAAEGHQILFELRDPLYKLFKEGFACDGVEIVARSAMAARMADCEAHVLLMSLPHYFKTSKDTIPSDTPYLTVSQDHIDAQIKTLPATTRKRIGVVRTGQSLHGGDYARSIRADIFQPLLEANADFYALQITKFDHEKVGELGLGFRDFADTAAAIMAMDLVITVDTAIAHLAGALGKKVWILIPAAPDWRWGLSGDKTPWYPAARLFRSTGPDDWPRVIADLRKVLDDFLIPKEKPVDAIAQIAAAERAIAKDPSKPAHYRALAEAHAGAGDAKKAAALYAELADVELRDEVYEDAIADYDRAIALDDSSAHLFNNYGAALRALNRGDAAIAAFTRALSIDPVLHSALSNRANTHWEAGNHQAAFADHRAAIEAQPDNAQVRVNHAVALRETGALIEALAEYDRAIELQPDFAQAHYDRGQLLAQMGDLKQGFAEMEWRWAKSYSYKERPRRYKQPVWHGQLPEELRGRLLVISEQGYGDTIQFSRYAPLLVECGYRVVLEVQPPLLRLYREGFARKNLRIVGRTTPPDAKLHGVLGMSHFDFAAYIGMLSLPQRFATTLKTIPAPTPYLSARPAEVAKWARRMKLLRAQQRALKIGLVWQGDPKHKQDKTRSLPPALLQPLLEVPGVHFYSLQKGAMEGWRFSQRSVTSLGPALEDFADTAAAIANLDLVISADTAAAHLAGALGKPVWIMLTKIGEWRWLTDTDTSPWYPTARLFRQSVQGEWQDVIERMARELRDLADSS